MCGCTMYNVSLIALNDDEWYTPKFFRTEIAPYRTINYIYNMVKDKMRTVSTFNCEVFNYNCE